MTRTAIRIGGACGFWGDSSIAAPQLLRSGTLDYLVFDYLAEITVSIMARARAKEPEHGYAQDFVEQTLPAILADCATSGVKIIANAGGVNPLACSAAIEKLVAQLGLELRVATVTGDDLLHQAGNFCDKVEMFSGAVFPRNPLSINAYLGAAPIAEALDCGADIVITGRCVDSALALGACIHAFDWRPDQFDLLAAGSLAGHILECGAQATGGLFTDWEDVPEWDNIGYPIVEIATDGSFLVSKPNNTGGLVTIATVAEQMLYEIGDPTAYLLPDVTCDFSHVVIEQAGPDIVRVAGVKGRPAPDNYKVSVTYQDGYRLALNLTVYGIDADRKAHRTGEAVLTRVARMLSSRGEAPLSETSIEVLGSEAAYGPHRRVMAPREVVLKVAAKHSKPGPLALLLREATSSGTSMSPGTTGGAGSRPKPSPVVRLFSFLLDKKEITPCVHIDGTMTNVMSSPIRTSPFVPTAERFVASDPPLAADFVEVPLVALAWGRSGDKGDKANIGIIARRSDYLPWIRRALTEDAIASYFRHLVEGPVTRFDVPGINAVNFLLARALGGGGIASLRNDPQGKGFAQILLNYSIPVPREIADRDGLVPVQL